MTPQDDTEYELVDPREALELYLDHKERQGASPSTISSHRSRLEFFTEWFEHETDHDWFCELSGLDLKRWEEWRYTDHSVHTVSTQQDTIRVFVRFLAAIDAVDEALIDKVRSPARPGGQRSNEIPAERAESILKHLDRYEYASIDHVLAHLLWYSMCRVGTVRSMDLGDVDLDEGYIDLAHTPGEDTPLKNGEKSERTIAIRPKTCVLLRDYIGENRVDETDEYGRQPLVTVEGGGARPSISTLRNHVYGLTRPCYHSVECPHDRDEDSCEAAQNVNDACKCPSSESTHAFRRGSISWHLREGTPKQIVSDRADVSPSVIESSYSTLSDREQADVRAEELPDGLGGD